MISVDRTVESLPAVLADADSKGRREVAAWTAYYEAVDAGEEPEEPSAFRAYTEVRNELEEIFHDKCAYCESRVTAISYGDIEHFRPKKAVELNNGTKRDRGYWWRAADWENLLLSCTLCNQQGKRIKFPLADESCRATFPGEEADEVPLLIDPTVEPPERHLAVGEAGEVRAVLLSTDPPGDASMGQATIDVFQLNRAALIKERRQLLNLIVALVEDCRDLLLDIDELPSDSERALEKRERYEQKVAMLKELLEPDQEFLLLARQVARPFLQEIGMVEAG